VVLCAVADLCDNFRAIANALDEVVSDPLKVVEGCGELASLGITLRDKECVEAAAAAAGSRTAVSDPFKLSRAAESLPALA
jgi:hypothetical protein